MITYKNYTIEEDFRNPYNNVPEFMFYKTEEGIQHDGDGGPDGYKYCGNCKWADSVEDAMLEIDELAYEEIS